MKKSKEFQCLVELTDIVNRHKVKQIEVIGNPKSSHIPISRYWAFYEQMVDGNFRDDRDAIAFFSLEENDRSYKKLRLGLQNRLLNTLFFIDQSNDHTDEYAKINIELWKKYSALAILLKKGARILSTELAKDILRIAEKYQITGIAYLAASKLKGLYSRDSEKHKEYEKYNKLMWHYFETKRVELKALEYYERAVMPYIAEKSTKAHMANQIQASIKKMDLVPQKLRSEQFLRIHYLLRIYVPMSEHKWVETTAIAREAIAYYQHQSHFPKRITSVFLQQKILAEIMLKNYQNACDDILLAEKYMPKYSKGWFKLKELETMIQLYSSDYKKAWNLIKTILRHKRFDSLSEVNKETWYVYNAYISFIQLIGKVALSPREKGALKQFRLSKFINDVPVFSRDKQGMNISILIIQVLILLYEEKYDDLDHKIESLMKYKKRKLSDISLRTGYFIKIIQSLKRGNFLKSKVIHKATPYFEKLEKIEMDLSNQGVEFEVIPYPILWEYIQEILTD